MADVFHAQAAVLEAAYALTRRGGRVVTVGLPNPAELFAISPTGLVGDNKTIITILMAIWSGGVLIAVAWLIGGWLSLKRLLRTCQGISDCRLHDLLDATARVAASVAPSATRAVRPASSR